MAKPQRIMKPFRKAKRLSNKIKSELEKAQKEKEIDIEISNVIVGGSVAHGTAIPGYFDIDITIFSPSLHPKREESRSKESLYKRGLEQIMECLQISLTNHYKISNVEELYGNHGRRFKCWHFRVDLSLSTKWDNLDDMCKCLKLLPPKERKLLSMGVTEYNNELLSKQPHRVKVLIKRFKKWRSETSWPKGSNIDGAGYPKSILLSFFVLISYERAPEHYKRAKRLKTLANWMTEDLKDLIRDIKDKSEDWKVPGENPLVEKYIDKHEPGKQRIRDPVNPFKDYYRQGLGEIEQRGGDDIPQRWEIFAEKIESLNLVMNLT